VSVPDPALRRWQGTAAVALGTAGALNLAAAVQHLSGGNAVVGFYLTAAVALAGAAVRLAAGGWTGLRPPVGLLVLVIAGTLVLLGVYLVAQTTDLLGAFTVTGFGSGHDHGTDLAPDPATGLDFSQGVAFQFQGPVPLDGAVPAPENRPTGVDVATTATELVALVALTALLPRTWRGRTLDAVLALGGVAWLLWLTGVLR